MSSSQHDAVKPAGRIDISETAIASIVQSAVLSTYGIVGMAPRSLGSAITRRFGRSSPKQGIAVRILDGHIAIELSVIVEYGTPIFAVARNLMKSVTFQVERAIGMPVDRVDVNVQGLRAGAESAR